MPDNRKARFHYSIGDTVEAGVALHGTEVKSLRVGQGSLNEAYAQATKQGEIVLLNAYIPVYLQAHQFNHETRRPRSEEHTSELQSLMRISYAVFCLTKKKKHNKHNKAENII